MGEGGKDINWFLDFWVCHVQGKEHIHVNFFSMGFRCKDSIQSVNVSGIWCVIGQSDYSLGIKSILSLDLPFNHLILPFPSSIFFPLGSKRFVFFPPLLYLCQDLYFLTGYQKKTKWMSQFFTKWFFETLCKRKERRIVISNHQQTQQCYHFGRKNVATSEDGLFSHRRHILLANDGGSQDHNAIREGSWSLEYDERRN